MTEIFNEIIDSFENEDIKTFFIEKCIPTVPEYWYHVWASSTGKYHPSYTVCDGGLAKHTVAVVRFLNHMFEIESIANQFTSRERDLLRVAGAMHDTRKSGTQEDYDNNKYTNFDHPIQAANVIRSLDGLPEHEIRMIAHAIESHMGQWNTDKRNPEMVLPKPEDKYQIIVHLADYFASRKDIEILFDINPSRDADSQPDINTWRFPFGKFKGKTIPEVAKDNKWYIKWAKENMDKEPAKTLLASFEI